MRRSSLLLLRVLPPAIVFVLATGIAEAYLRLAHVPAYVMTPPSGVVHVLLQGDDRAELLTALGWTALAAGGGFLVSAIVGIAVALVLSTSSLIRRAIYPYTIFFQTVPIIAIAPLLVIALGFGLWPVIVCAFVVSVFPVIVNTLGGLLSTDPALLDLFRLYRGCALATLWKLRLPWALPGIFAGLRIAAGLSVIGTVVAEFMVGDAVGKVGLGVIITSGAAHRMDKATAAVLLASLLGLAMFGLLNLLSWLALRRWHASEK